MRYEDQLLVNCLLESAEFPVSGEKGALGCSVIDWEYFLEVVAREGTELFVFPILLDKLTSLVPEDQKSAIKSILLKKTVISLRYTGVLVNIITRFERKGVDVIPFKGPILSQRLYGDPAKRSFGDLDILVRPEYVFSAITVLRDAGYTPQLEISEEQLDLYCEHEDNIIFSNASLSSVIELHWELSGRVFSRPYMYLDVVERCAAIDIAGKELLAFGDEDLLVYLCVHGAKHSWDRLEWLLSVKKLLDISGALNWDIVFLLMKRFRCRRNVLFGLYLVKEFFNVNFPWDVSQKIEAERGFAGMVSYCGSPLLKDKLGVVSKSEHPDRFSVFQFAIQDNLYQRIRWGGILLFRPTERDWRCWPLPRQLKVLNYVFRPFRLLVAGFQRIWWCSK
ncbi:nucleotidyltransferase family protein [Desulfosediminicola sp.]|uniref:nucleotidyltransferase domain-containing protein n=1 Tax=Desulfosediminicola sp. TaxID=2886825 RepID=UPI003AF2EC28